MLLMSPATDVKHSSGNPVPSKPQTRSRRGRRVGGARLLLATLLGAGSLVGSNAFASDSPAAAPPDTVVVERFQPEGTARRVEQVSVRFSEPMVALGDARLPDPFDVTCPVKGHGLWADGRSWTYDFDSDLPGGVRCVFRLHDNLKALSGHASAGRKQFEFSTGGPSVVAAFPHDGSHNIDEEQLFLVRFNSPVRVASLKEHARCLVDGIAEEIAVAVLEGADRARVLAQRTALGYGYFALTYSDTDAGFTAPDAAALPQVEAQIVVLACQRRLPPATGVTLNIARGLQSESGIATTTDRKLRFTVRPAFTARVECSRINARAGCLPFQPIVVSFSTPVPRALATLVRLRPREGAERSPAEAGLLGGDTLDSLTFAGPFPEGQPVTVVIPPGLVDDSHRTLDNAARFPLEVRVDEAPPLAKFSASFGILEASEGGVLPLTLRNVEPDLVARQIVLAGRELKVAKDPAEVARWMNRVKEAGAPRGEMVRRKQPADKKGAPAVEWREATGDRSVFSGKESPTAFSVTKPAGAKPMEVVGIPLRTPGFYVVEVESRVLGRALLGRDQTRYVTTAALVTDLAVHFKWGKDSSVVWVTRLHDGAPVAGADVTIVPFCGGKSLWSGRTNGDGIASVTESLGDPRSGSECYPHMQTESSPLLVTASLGDDFSFTQSGWANGIEPEQFGLRVDGEHSRVVAHTVLDRALFRAGETVSMKHFMRRRVMAGFTVAPGYQGEHTVLIRHEGSGQQYEQRVQFDAAGIGESAWTIPAEAKLGVYTVSIRDGSAEHSAGSFRVEEFRLPSMRGSVSSPTPMLVNPQSATLDLHVAYLSGGGAAGLPVKLRTIVEPRAAGFPAYPDYQFGGRSVKEGVSSDQGAAVDGEDDEAAAEDQPAAATSKSQVMPLTLDAAGSARVSVPNIPKTEGPAQLVAELEYADANGEILTATGRVQLLQAGVSIGIRREGWVANSEQLRFKVLVVAADGKPLRGRPVQVALYHRSHYSYRKRLIGGFYAYESVQDTRRLSIGCQGSTDSQGIVACEIAPKVSGELVLRAEAKDDAGRPAGATTSVWVANGDDWWFGGTAGDRMDLLPEKPAYESGDRARLQVRMPFREATALVSVEREGIIKSFVTHLQGKHPVVEVPIEANYAPNVFVSVLALRGRVAHADHAPATAGAEEISALVDLNKPAYRLGFAELKVGWKPHRLDVSVAADRKAYRVRDQANVKFHVARGDGGSLPAGAEVAVAAVDEALLDLIPNASTDLLAAMMGSRGLEVRTSTGQMQVVGKRHYGRKAVAAGGGGGRNAGRGRELFDSLLLWKGRVIVDGSGNAAVTVPLNDSLTTFRIVAVASAGASYFGSGATTIQTHQELILQSGLPPLVRDGDHFSATFNVRNTTSRTMSVELSAHVTPLPAAAPVVQTFSLPAGRGRDVTWEIDAPSARALQWDVSARDPKGTAQDRVRVTQSIIPSLPVETYQATLMQTTGPLSVPVAMPKEAASGRGGIGISLRATLGSGLSGVRDYFEQYPYDCLEQQTSSAIGRHDRAAWDRMVARMPAYVDEDGLLRFFPTDRLSGDDTLTAYVLAASAESGYGLPAAQQDRLVEALGKFVRGKVSRRSALNTADLTVRRLAAINALSYYGAADPGMLDSITVDTDRWPMSALLDWVGILKRVPGIARARDQEVAAYAQLRGRLRVSGTSLALSATQGDWLWWLMVSPDANASRLLLAVVDRDDWKEDAGKLARGVLARQRRGHWDTTVANAWGTLAMDRFSARFEAVPVAGKTRLKYGGESREVAWPDAGTRDLELPWSAVPAPLEITHLGTGQPWILASSRVALPLTAPISAGFTIARTVSPVEQKVAGHVTRGDVFRVHLDLSAAADATWVVVSDPVPAGATVLGGAMGGQSALLDAAGRNSGAAWLAYEERRFDGLRAFYRYVPKGKWTLEYTMRVNNPGDFSLPPTRVEAMYMPEVYAAAPNARLRVEPIP